jgi:DNA-binding NarL/FixJ family response regulator
MAGARATFPRFRCLAVAVGVACLGAAIGAPTAAAELGLPGLGATNATAAGLDAQLSDAAVLALIACGYSTSGIASALWITEDTVRTHVKRLLARLSARTRAHAVAIAFRDGLWKLEQPERGDAV